ncbi:MAG: hypothetical protein JWN48_1477 [Myxococcaceae bacterium]|nr:hypothetical protein [Myxococcaceae bacterium]
MATARVPRFAARVLICLLALLGMGCAATSERLAGWYVTRTLDSYLDFDPEQKRAARLQVDQTLLMLRRNELPHWVSFLREVRQGIHDGMSEEQLARLQRHYDARLDVAVQLVAPPLSALLVGLHDEQLDHFAARMRKDVEQQYEELALPREKRSAEIEKRALKFVEGLVGDLSDRQEQTLRAMVRGLPDERPAQRRAALDAIARFRGFMGQHPDAARLEAELERMWAQRYDALGTGHDKTARRAVQRKWLLSVYALLTREQRDHAEAEISDRIVTVKRFVIPG